MSPTAIRLCGLAGLLGALSMFLGDMLFYGQWGDGQTGMQHLDIVRQTDPQRLAWGGLTSVTGGIGYALGAVHVFGRLSARYSWTRVLVSGGFLILAIFAATTHAVWGSFALSIRTDSASAEVVGDYLATYFRYGGYAGIPTSLLLAAAILARRTRWPVWFVLINPGAIYFTLVSATYLPAPLGAAIIGGAFNLAFALFYGISLLVPIKPVR